MTNEKEKEIKINIVPADNQSKYYYNIWVVSDNGPELSDKFMCWAEDNQINVKLESRGSVFWYDLRDQTFLVIDNEEDAIKISLAWL